MAPEKKRYARVLRQRSTPAEQLLWSLLRRKALGHRFHRQSPLFGYFADFYCPEAMLVVEADGPYHAKRADLDRSRDRHLAMHGLITLRFSNELILSHPEGVIGAIRGEIPAGLERAKRWRGRS